MTHDSLVRAMLSDPRRAKEFLLHNLPNNVAGLLDDKPPVLKGDTFIDTNLDRSQADLLFEVGLQSGKPALLYVLVEAKSRNDPGTPLQLATYMLRIWSRYAEEDRGTRLKALRPIIPLVLYHGRERWTAPTSLAEAVDTSGTPELTFEPGSYILRDIRHLPVEKLSPNPGLRAGEIALSGRAREHMDDMLDGLEPDSEFRRQVVGYITRTYERSTAEEMMMALTARNHEQEAKEVGRRGMTYWEEGKAEGEAKSLTRLLERRFGPLPRSARDRIAAASIEQLDRWLDRVLDATSLDELLGEAEAS